MDRTISHLSIVTTSSLPSLEQAVDFPQNVGNRLHFTILLYDKDELQDQEHITLTAALKSLIHPFALSFKYSQITGLPHGIGGDLLLLVCLEPGAQQPRGLRFLNQLLHTSIFPLLHTMVQVFLFSWIGGEQRTLLVNLKHHSNSSKDKTQEYWDQSLINHQV